MELVPPAHQTPSSSCPHLHQTILVLIQLVRPLILIDVSYLSCKGWTHSCNSDQSILLGEATDENFATSTTRAGSDRTTCSISIAITAILTALLATGIFVLVQIAICKCHPKFKPESAASAGGKEEVLYKQMDDRGVRGVAVQDPTYMEVGAGGEGENILKLKKNEAYETFLVR